MPEHETRLSPAPAAGLNAIDLINKYRRPIMGFATLWILMFHEWELVFVNIPLLNYAERVIRRIGFCGVDFFLFLSGMGLTYSIRGRSVASFYARRLRRLILPCAAMALLFAYLKQWTLLEFVQNVSGYNFWMKNMYSFLWFFYAIFPMYLVFPWYYRLFMKHTHRTRFFGAVLLCWLTAAIGLKDVLREDLYGFVNRIPIFLTGVYFGAHTDKSRYTMTRSRWVLLVGMLAVGFVLSVLTNYAGLYVLVPVSNAFVPNYLMTISLSVLLAGLLEKLPKGLNKGLCAFLGFFGMISFEVYCVEDPLGAVVHSYGLNTFGNPILVNLLTFGVITAVSYGVYRLFDGFWKLADRKGAGK